jgi:hypothetical protein
MRRKAEIESNSSLQVLGVDEYMLRKGILLFSLRVCSIKGSGRADRQKKDVAAHFDMARKKASAAFHDRLVPVLPIGLKMRIPMSFRRYFYAQRP